MNASADLRASDSNLETLGLQVNSDTKPLVTFALFAYNQERFICDAVAGALAQTYSPLEIILSDDCSTDSTFELMKQMSREYQGPHKIRLNRNEENLGIGSHVTKVLLGATGKLVVVGAGDDISLNNRVEAIVDCWLQNGTPAAVASLYTRIDIDGNELPQKQLRIGRNPVASAGQTAIDRALLYLRCKTAPVPGCTAAWAKQVVEEFGAIPADVRAEDSVLTLRALLLKPVFFLKVPLVQYRVLSSSVSRSQDFSTRAEAMCRAHVDDVDKAFAAGIVSHEEASKLREEIMKLKKRIAINACWNELSFMKKLSLIPSLGHWSIGQRFSRFLPKCLYDAMKQIVYRR